MSSHDYTHTLAAFRRSAEEVERSYLGRDGHVSKEKVDRSVANALIVRHHWAALEQHYAELAEEDA